MLGILKLMQPQLEVVATTVRVDTTMQYMCYQGDIPLILYHKA